uniref:Uncharacterized protein n=1 Tax=Rhizophora mucronata TaxID=61149 RepID=A0A2P2PIN4_RHIMU
MIRSGRSNSASSEAAISELVDSCVLSKAK